MGLIAVMKNGTNPASPQDTAGTELATAQCNSKQLNQINQARQQGLARVNLGECWNQGIAQSVFERNPTNQDQQDVMKRIRQAKDMMASGGIRYKCPTLDATQFHNSVETR